MRSRHSHVAYLSPVHTSCMIRSDRRLGSASDKTAATTTSRRFEQHRFTILLQVSVNVHSQAGIHSYLHSRFPNNISDRQFSQYDQEEEKFTHTHTLAHIKALHFFSFFYLLFIECHGIGDELHVARSNQSACCDGSPPNRSRTSVGFSASTPEEPRIHATLAAAQTGAIAIAAEGSH